MKNKKEDKSQPVKTHKGSVYHLTDKVMLTLTEPTIGKNKKLKSLGFDTSNPAMMNEAYMAMTQSEKILESVVSIIFEGDFPKSEIENFSLKEVKRGYYDYLGESGIVIVF